jgi:peptidoglycan/LPS O-acetylase OafA/YrhL
VRPSLTYRPDIDGLRAVAITMVIAYHAFPGLLPGGFTGVDVFFVISGYLITQLVLAGLQQRTFSLLEFYQRRVRRIVPPLLVVLAACFAMAWFTLLPGEFRWFGRSVLWSAPFLANVFFAHVTGYFDPGAHYNVLLHLWSLGVEEQFYLLWPILLMLAVRYGVTVRVLAAVTAASFAISLWGAHAAPTVHFFLPGSRAWELAVGAMLAAVPPGAFHATVADTASSRGGSWCAYARWGSLAGLALIAAGALFLSADDSFPGAWGVIPTGGAALLIAAGPDSLVNRRLLATSPLVLIGRLSYSLYLWHWPLFVFARAIWGQELSHAAIAGVIATAFAAAWTTYRLVETPIRSGALGRAAFPALLAGLAGFTALGSFTADGRLPGRLSGPQFAAWEAAVIDWDISTGGSLDKHSGFDTLIVRSRRPATTLFIGDSHMQQYWPRVAYLVDTYPDNVRSVQFMAYAGCPILPGLNSLRQPRDCDGFFAAATAQAFQPEIDTVVFGAFWELYLLGEFSLDQHQGVYSSRDLLRRQLRLDSRGTQIALQQFERLLARLVASGRRVFIVLSNPTSPQFDPPALVPWQVRLSLHRPGVLVTDRTRVDAAPFETFVAPLMSRLREIAARAGAQVLDPRSTLCAGMMCPAVAADGTPLFIDSNHLRASFAREHASFLDETLLVPQPH